MKPADTRKTRSLDVRPMMARGEEPFVKIMATVAALGEKEEFLLVTPFVPSPLIEKLRSEGFEAQAERRSDGGWQTRFSRG